MKMLSFVDAFRLFGHVFLLFYEPSFTNRRKFIFETFFKDGEEFDRRIWAIWGFFSAVLYPEPQCGANAALAANSHLDWQKPCVAKELLH